MRYGQTGNDKRHRNCGAANHFRKQNVSPVGLLSGRLNYLGASMQNRSTLMTVV
jgi:hypothetical protein